MAEPLLVPDPTTIPTEPARDKNADPLKKAYDQAVAKVNETPPGTPEYFHAREAKKAAFQKYNDAARVKAETDAVVAVAEQKQQAADAANREAQAAKKAAMASTRQSGAGARSTATAANAETDADVSPLSETNAAEAIDQISRMRSRPQLEQIANNDQRVSVKAAAQERLGKL